MEVSASNEAPQARTSKRAASGGRREGAEAKGMKRRRDDASTPPTPELPADEMLPSGTAVSSPSPADAKSPPRRVATPAPVANNGTDGATNEAPAPAPPAPAPPAPAVKTEGAPAASTSDRLAADAALGLLGLVDAAASAAKEEGLAPAPPAAAAPRTAVPLGTLGDRKAASTPTPAMMASPGARPVTNAAAIAAQAKMQAMAMASVRTASMPSLLAAASALGNSPTPLGLVGSPPAGPLNFEVSTAALVAAANANAGAVRPAATRSLSMPMLKKSSDDKDKAPSKRSLILLEKKAQGICTAPGCDAKAEGGFRRCTACRNHDRERQRRLRAEAMGTAMPGAPAPLAAQTHTTASAPAAPAQAHAAAASHTASAWSSTAAAATGTTAAAKSVPNVMSPSVAGGAGVTVK